MVRQVKALKIVAITLASLAALYVVFKLKYLDSNKVEQTLESEWGIKATIHCHDGSAREGTATDCDAQDRGGDHLTLHLSFGGETDRMAVEGPGGVYQRLAPVLASVQQKEGADAELDCHTAKKYVVVKFPEVAWCLLTRGGKPSRLLQLGLVDPIGALFLWKAYTLPEERGQKQLEQLGLHAVVTCPKFELKTGASFTCKVAEPGGNVFDLNMKLSTEGMRAAFDGYLTPPTIAAFGVDNELHCPKRHTNVGEAVTCTFTHEGKEHRVTGTLDERGMFTWKSVPK